MPPGAVIRVSTGGYLLNGQWFPDIGGIRRGESYSRVFASIDMLPPRLGSGLYGHTNLAEEWRHLPARCLFVPTLGM